MREARTEPLDQPQPVITQGRPHDPHAGAALAQAAAPASEADPMGALLKEMGVSLPPSSDPIGVCTLRDGTALTLRELDGEDETTVEALMEQRGIGIGGAGKATNLRFLALMSIHTIDGKEQAPVRHAEQLARLLTYKTPDMNRIIGAYVRYNLANGDSAPFRRASA